MELSDQRSDVEFEIPLHGMVTDPQPTNDEDLCLGSFFLHLVWRAQ